MASLQLKNIYKVYPSGNVAVTDFNLDIEDKEFIVFVGPSGCGKSTTLRMIAGLEEISSGELYIDGKLMNNVSPKDRDIAFVFQSYALYPHMTVYDNMAFGLKLRKMPKEEIDARVKEAARILGIEIYLSRKPKALSGGQRQRVALGRAIVREPKVFLLDEPLSNLDAKLRAQMRTEITKLHNRLATTFIYVTHDQIEAMTMGTRIVVMKDGYMQQVDAPQNLYDYPINKFVAGFIGTPQMNFFDAKLTGDKNHVYVEFGTDKIMLPEDKVELIYDLDQYLNTGKEVVFGLRPEDLHDEEAFKATGAQTIKVRVDVAEMLGSETQLYCKASAAQQAEETVQAIVDDSNTIIARVDCRTNTKKDDIIELALDLAHCHLFDKETEMTILAKNKEEKETYLKNQAEAAAAATEKAE
ncbi:MAG: sn-glycerol-3-phosphate ABC transporter ATP-binding protein UgpC [Clostridia bacterium]|nr:sn-glycerol-3-phosphate ABC transporter ATP-binding protein UgpC [Clostridia bacterium]